MVRRERDPVRHARAEDCLPHALDRRPARGRGAGSDLISHAPGRQLLYTVPMDLQALSDVSLLDANETPRRLGDYWQDHDTVLVFLRHVG